ncbi:MAG: hypothetical protein COB33_005915 [Thiotrichaceae bacterium]|nr:hypothetical protein [Thiotrichaceae bacterium]
MVALFIGLPLSECSTAPSDECPPQDRPCEAGAVLRYQSYRSYAAMGVDDETQQLY